MNMSTTAHHAMKECTSIIPTRAMQQGQQRLPTLNTIAFRTAKPLTSRQLTIPAQ